MRAATRLLATSVVGFALMAAGATFAEGTGASLSRASTKTSATGEIGPVAKACGVRGKALGKVVEKGPGRWNLHDTAPGSTAPRVFYLTGFKDGCPRRLTGAVAMFGSVDLYELVHYGPVGLSPPASATDTAYARLRAKTCGQGACSARGIKRLARSAVFVSVYPSPGSAKRLELLMSGGRLAAAALK